MVLLLYGIVLCVITNCACLAGYGDHHGNHALPGAQKMSQVKTNRLFRDRRAVNNVVVEDSDLDNQTLTSNDGRAVTYTDLTSGTSEEPLSETTLNSTDSFTNSTDNAENNIEHSINQTDQADDNVTARAIVSTLSPTHHNITESLQTSPHSSLTVPSSATSVSSIHSSTNVTVEHSQTTAQAAVTPGRIETSTSHTTRSFSQTLTEPNDNAVNNSTDLPVGAIVSDVNDTGDINTTYTVHTSSMGTTNSLQDNVETKVVEPTSAISPGEPSGNNNDGVTQPALTYTMSATSDATLPASQQSSTVTIKQHTDGNVTSADPDLTQTDGSGDVMTTTEAGTLTSFTGTCM